MGEVLLKVHKSYRWVVAVCDKEVFGKVLKERGRILDLSGEFFKGEVLGEDKVKKEIVRCQKEDATFNFVGENSVKIAKGLGLVKESGVVEIEGVPVALVLL